VQWLLPRRKGANQQMRGSPRGGASDAQGANLVVNETFNKNLAAAQR
jgi:hypothetical protein